MARFRFLLAVAILGMSFMLSPATALANSCKISSGDGTESCEISCPDGQQAKCTHTHTQAFCECD